MAKAKPAVKDDPKSKALVANNGGEDAGGALVLVQDQVPEHLKASMESTRGNENVATEDLVIPRLEVVQAISEAMDPASAGYIEGAKVGDLINSVTNQNYGREVFVVPVSYSKQFLVWKDRKAGGGFFGSYSNMEDAQKRADAEGGTKAQVEVIDTPTHLCLIIDRERGKAEEIMISMPRTKAKISRQWNSMVKMAGGDRFSRVYKVATAQEKNTKGTFANYTVMQSAFPAKSLFLQAEKLYEFVKSGARNIVMDTKGFNAGDEDEGAAAAAAGGKPEM